jgi:hypothetical protein
MFDMHIIAGWVSRNSLRGIERSYLDSRWVTTPRCVVRNGTLRQCFQSCMELLVLGMLPWLIIFSSLMALFSSFSGRLYSIKLKKVGADNLCWNPSKKGLFNIRLFYYVLISYDTNPFPWWCIWQSRAPLRVTFFAYCG